MTRPTKSPARTVVIRFVANDRLHARTSVRRARIRLFRTHASDTALKRAIVSVCPRWLLLSENLELGGARCEGPGDRVESTGRSAGWLV